MDSLKLVRMMITILFALMTICGLLAIRYTGVRHKFVVSKLYIIYSVIFAITFTTIYMYQLHRDYTKQLFQLRDAVKVGRLLNVFVAIINYITQFAMNKKVGEFMNKVPIFSTIKYFHLDQATLRHAVIVSLMRACLFPFIIEITLILQSQRNQPERSWIWTLYTLFPNIVSNMLNNCYFGAMILVRTIFEALNLRIQTIAKEVNFMQSPIGMSLHKPYYRMQRFCDLADELDVLANKYKMVCAQSQAYLELMALSLICSLSCNLVSITVGCFHQYQAIADTFINKVPYETFSALTNLVFLVVSFTEVTLLSRLCNSVLIETRDTGYQLKTMTLKFADIRFKRSVDAFSLLVTTIKFKIMPLGLFDINVSLVNDVTGTVASFLVILIQSDLSLRFALK